MARWWSYAGDISLNFTIGFHSLLLDNLSPVMVMMHVMTDDDVGNDYDDDAGNDDADDV